MTDIAQIGFKADTSDLDKAVLTLNKLQAASKGVATSTNTAARSVEGNSRTMAQASLEVARAVTMKKKAELDALVATGRMTAAEFKHAKEALNLAKAQESSARSILATAKANETLQRATIAATQSQTKQLSVMQRINQVTGVSRGMPKSARESAGVFGGIANDQLPNRFNTANIAAQFQDIGVTAAMGMNPLTVALQQGTQLSAILNTMESPLKGLAIAFRSIINPVSLMAIAFTGTLVALIQFVDWTKVAKGALNGLANIIQATAPYVLTLGAVLSVLYAPAILAGIAAVTMSIATMGKTALVAGARMAAAWIIAMGPIGWVAAGIAVVLAALFAFKDELANLLGFDVLNMLKEGVNKIIGFFVGAFNGIKAAWGVLPQAIGSIVIETANKILGTLEKLINEVVERLNRLPGVEIDLKFDGQGNLANPYAEQAQEAGKLIGAEMDKALPKDYVGAVGAVVDGLANKVRGFADGIGTGEDDKKKGGKTEAERYEDLIGSANRRIATLRAEQAALGLTREAAAALKYEQELINDAMQKNIDLTPQQRQQLEDLAGTMAKIEEETRKAKEAMDFAKDTTKGFFKDMRTSIQEGKSLWESFAGAAINAINKILDKMMDAAIDDLFGSLTGGISGGSSGGGGFLGSIVSGISGFLFNAKGNAFSQSGVEKFANGGAFTNGIYSSPTLFKFANGGQFGMMGEAGPEAVMPLHRGSDGSLGVKMSGNAGGNNTAVTYNIDARGAEPGVEMRIEQAIRSIEQLRRDTPKIAIESVKDANNRNLGFLR